MKNQELRTLLQEQYKLIEKHEDTTAANYWHDTCNAITELSQKYPEYHPLHKLAIIICLASFDILEAISKGENNGTAV